ncbi:hypothetical protein ACHAWT_008849 [Skeletonema menzelii]
MAPFQHCYALIAFFSLERTTARLATMVHSPTPLMLEGGKCGKKKKEGGMINSPPKLNSSIFDSEYFPTNKRQKYENVQDTTISLLCNNSTLERSINGQQNKSIAFADLIPKHTPFVGTEQTRKIGLTPRLHRCRRDDSQYKNCLPEQKSSQIDPFSATMLEPTVDSPRPHETSSSLISSSIDVFSQQRLGQEAQEEQTKFDEFTLTPTCLYDEDDEEEAAPDHHLPRPQSVPIKRYHRSPHWSGRVNINPFSPVPEHYLNPPSSMSPSQPILGHESQNVLLPADNTRLNSPKQKKTKRTNLSPMKVCPRLNHRVDNVKTSKATSDVTSPKKKRKANSDMATNNDGESTQQKSGGSKRICLPNQRSRYTEDFEEIEFLGSGSFGAVCACLSRLDGCMYAVKSISPDGVALRNTNSLYGGRHSSDTTLIVPPTPRRDIVPSSARRSKSKSRTSPPNNDDDEDLSPQMVLRGSRHWSENTLNRMLREVFALAALCNQSDLRTFHIVRYHQAWLEDDGNLYIQTELCKATLRDEMNSGERMDVVRQLKILREVLLALQLVHEQGCVHLDIKPHNIFVKDDMYKLGDFGTATLRNEINAKTGKAMDVEEGDSRYMPRDLLEGTPEDLTKCDIFSLGLTLYETCIVRPLPLCGQEWQDLRNGKLSKPVDINPTLYVIIKQMMHPDPSKRPSASDLLARSELSANSNNVFLPHAKTPSNSARPLPLKRERSLSWTL